MMIEDTHRWFPEACKDGIDLMMLVLGVAGEAGEVADVLKKYVRGSLSREEMFGAIAFETIDVFHYLCLIWYILQIDPGEVYRQKREYNERRFGGSSNHQSSEDVGTE